MRLAWGELSTAQGAGRLPQMTGTAKLVFRPPMKGAFREKGEGKAEATREEAAAIFLPHRKGAESQS